jgi:hypothetical protein
VGASGGVFSPSCDASHLHPAPLQQHQAAQGRPGHHSSSAAGALLFARADRLLLGSDLPRGSLEAAPALGCLGPRPAGGLRHSTHSRLLGDYAAAFGWWPDWLACIEPRPLPLHLSRLLGLRGSGRWAQGNRRTLAGVQQSGPAGCRYSAGHISSERAAWHSSIAEGRAGLFTARGEEAARFFQQGQWALAGRALRNPSAACPYGSH